MSSSKTNRRVSDAVHGVTDSSKAFVGEHPVTTTFAAFAIGLSVGVAAIYLIANGSQQRQETGLAHRLGRQVLDAIGKVVPDSIATFGRRT